MKTDWTQSQHEVRRAEFQSWNITNLHLQQAISNYSENKKPFKNLCAAAELQVGQTWVSTQGQRVSARWPELVKWDTSNLRVLLKRLSCKDPATMEKSHGVAISACICWCHLCAATRRPGLHSWGGRNEGDKHLRSWEPPSLFPLWPAAPLRNSLARQRPFLFLLFLQKCGKLLNTWWVDGA